MVLGAYEKYVFGPRREAQKRAAEAKKRAEEAKRKLKEAEKKGEEIRAWNERRLDAEAQGKPFNEPFPGENKQFQERRNPMVLGAYEEHVAGPRRRAKARADKAEKERDEVRARADKSEKELEEARAWNRRRLKAQADGEPFDEPYPDAEPES